MSQVDLERLDRILPTVRKPGRYVGGEYNASVKDWDAVSTRVCLAFPDVYDLGMSNLGLAILYDILNRMEDTLAERTYMPWVDMLATMRETGIPLYSLESKRALSDFDIVGFSLASEQLYTNVLEMLDLAGLPVRAAERGAGHPLIVAGGHAAFNPEPMAGFVDAFVIGDGEEVVVELVQAWHQVRHEPRESQLHALARIPGVYVPRFYEIRYGAGGTIESIEPADPDVPLPVLKRIVPTLPPPPTRLLVPNVDVSHNRATIEIQRGCTRGCRFCHAGIVARPVRERTVHEVLEAAEAILSETGFEEIGLLSLSSSDYSGIDRLVQSLVERFGERHVSISLPALRADSFSVGLAEAVARGRHTGFTFAPEAATERLRATINKPISTEMVVDTAREVFQRGWRTVKLYFLIGLPGERVEDVEAIAELSRAVLETGRQTHGRKTQVNVSVNTFIPKPHTPFQWAVLETESSLREKQALLRTELRGRGIKLSYSDPGETLLEAVLSRGDRRLGPVVEEAWRLGARFDAWGDQRNPNAWERAFEMHGIDPDFYARRGRSRDEVLPWDVISTGVRRAFLWKEFERSAGEETLADCREGCFGCGILSIYGENRTEAWCCPPASGRQN